MPSAASRARISSPSGSGAHPAEEPHLGAESSRRHRLVGALAPEVPAKLAPVTVSPGRGSRGRVTA